MLRYVRPQPSKVFSLNSLSTPLVLVLSLPLAFFAVCTTFFAIGTLLVRVGIVYVHLFLALVQSYILKIVSPVSKSQQTSATKSRPFQTLTINTDTSVRHHARRRTSSSSSSIAQTPAAGFTHNGQTHSITSAGLRRDQSLASLLSAAVAASSNPNSTQTPVPTVLTSAPYGSTAATGATTPRDYESVGGWRLVRAGSDDDDALWTGINSRLELPALTMPSPSATYRLGVLGNASRAHSTGPSATPSSAAGSVPSSRDAEYAPGTAAAQSARHSHGRRQSGKGGVQLAHSQHHQSRALGNGSPELRARSPSGGAGGRRRVRGATGGAGAAAAAAAAASRSRKGSSGDVSPEGYFGSAGLGMTVQVPSTDGAGGAGQGREQQGLGSDKAQRSHRRGGSGGSGESASRGASRRGSVTVKVRGE